MDIINILFESHNIYGDVDLTKRAIILISLVPEAKTTGNKEIEKQIKKESSIPFLAKVEKVTIEEVENHYQELREHGFSKKVAHNIVRFYEG
jgi:uncharacterized protein (UPF0335 family)